MKQIFLIGFCIVVLTGAALIYSVVLSSKSAQIITLDDIEHEVRSAINVSYASAYWDLALTLQGYVDEDLQNQMWDEAEAFLSKFPDTDENLRHVLEATELQKNSDNPGAWMVSEYYSGWYAADQLFRIPPNALRQGYFEKDRRVCRAVMSITLANALEDFEILKQNPSSSEIYWRFQADLWAFGHAYGACPEVMTHNDELLISMSNLSEKLSSLSSEYKGSFWPAIKSVPKDQGMNLTAFVSSDQQIPNFTLSELQADLDAITQKTVTYWEKGPDGWITRNWLGFRRFIAYLPD